MISITKNAYEMHLLVGALAAILSGKNWFWVVLTLGIGKEVYDFFDYGRPDWIDAVFTVLGGAIIAAVKLLMK